MSGVGQALWACGDEYNGEWRNCKRNGHGTHKFAIGYVYKGEWKDDLYEGSGVL